MPFPKTINTGSAIGIVTSAPKTDPLFKLSELPNTNIFKKIYELINERGKIGKLSSKFCVVPKEKIKLNSDTGMPIKNQYTKNF